VGFRLDSDGCFEANLSHAWLILRLSNPRSCLDSILSLDVFFSEGPESL